MNENEKLLADIKSTVDAIKAIKSGEPTEKPEVEEVVETPVAPVEEKPAEEVEKKEVEVEDKKEEVAEPVVEEPAVEPVVEPAKETEKSVSAEVLDSVKQIAEVVGALAKEVKALKEAKTARKGVMPAEEVEEKVEDKDEMLKKEAAYIFGK